jgi:putative phosphoribosyl transferase
MSSVFRDRKEAGRLLAGRLAGRGYLQPVVLAVSRGGVAIGYEVARALGAPLDVLPVNGAAAAHGHRGEVPVEGRSAIVVADELVPDGCLAATLAALRRRKPKRIVVAAPVATRAALVELAGEADDVVCLLRPLESGPVEHVYADHHDVSEAEASALLEREAAGSSPR